MSKILDFWAGLTGVVLPYALTTPPPDWIMCYGQALTDDVPEVARLRQKLIDDGYPYGKDGSDNPYVPDCRGRGIAGKDNMGGVAASRLTTGGSGIDGSTLGAAGGSQNVTLTSAQVPATGVTVNISDPGHAHGLTQLDFDHNDNSIGGGGPNSTRSTNEADIDWQTDVAVTGITASGTVQGGGQAHNNTPPTIVLNLIIKL